MERRRITEEQVEQLYGFTRKHFVEHYDLQTELVDHLAMIIEKQWELQPHLSFDKALQIEFKKFGVFGFMEVVEERHKALSKKYTKLIWKHFIEFFKLPKIVLTVVAIIMVYIILRIGFTNDFFFKALTLGLFFLALTPLIFISVQKKRAYKKGRKKWMFEDMLMQAGAGTSFTFLPLYFFQIVFPLNIDNINIAPELVVMLFSILFVGLLLLMYIIQIEIPKKAQKYLLETYPEYTLVMN